MLSYSVKFSEHRGIAGRGLTSTVLQVLLLPVFAWFAISPVILSFGWCKRLFLTNDRPEIRRCCVKPIHAARSLYRDTKYQGVLGRRAGLEQAGTEGEDWTRSAWSVLITTEDSPDAEGAACPNLLIVVIRRRLHSKPLAGSMSAMAVFPEQSL